MSEENSTYECPKNGCLLSFNKLEDLDLHSVIGKHKHYYTGSVYQQLKVDWASKFSALTIDEGREGMLQTCLVVQICQWVVLCMS